MIWLILILLAVVVPLAFCNLSAAGAADQVT